MTDYRDSFDTELQCEDIYGDVDLMEALKDWESDILENGMCDCGVAEAELCDRFGAVDCMAAMRREADDWNRVKEEEEDMMWELMAEERERKMDAAEPECDCGWECECDGCWEADCTCCGGHEEYECGDECDCCLCDFLECGGYEEAAREKLESMPKIETVTVNDDMVEYNGVMYEIPLGLRNKVVELPPEMSHKSYPVYKSFRVPVQVRFWDGEEWDYGIAYGNEIICACCGGTIHVDEVYETFEDDVALYGLTEPAITLLPWIDFMEAIGE